MNSEKILEVIERYRKYFSETGIDPKDYPHDYKLMFDIDMAAHCHGMLNKIETFVSEGRLEKAFRWLGFVQGCLWSFGVYSLEDLKNHNRLEEN